MDPVSIFELLHHSIDVRAKTTFNVDASLVLILNKFNASVAVPRLVWTRKSVFNISTITGLVCSCIAHIAENNLITLSIIITETHIANYAIILVVRLIVNKGYWSSRIIYLLFLNSW